MTFPINIFEDGHTYTVNTREELQEFASNYMVIYAAGGIILNEKGEIVMIYRRGYWDFPKGKIEVGEGAETAALREVAEETGITKAVISDTLPSTFHTYILNGKKILKQTYWFLMRTDSANCTLIPQSEEDIEDAVWVPLSQLDEKMKESYASLQTLTDKIKNRLHEEEKK